MNKSEYSFRNKVREYYRHERAQGSRPDQALIHARYLARYGDEQGWNKPRNKKLDLLPSTGCAYDGDKVTELPQGYSVKVEFQRDNEGRAPYEESDGHGVVVRERSRREGEHWEAWLLYSERHTYIYYDYEQTLPRAIKDGWNTSPFNDGLDERAKAYKAMRADYEFLRRWFNDDWWYVGLIVTLYKDGTEIAEESVWGIDSDSIGYLADTARGYVARMLHDHWSNEQENRFAAECEEKEKAYWAARDVVTVPGVRV
jgi:hypothetical protein